VQTETACSQRSETAAANRHAATRHPAVLVVGSFVAPMPLERYVSGDLAQRLAAGGWRATATSRKRNRLARLLDMATAVFRCRASFDLALVDVFSGPAFLWAEAVCGLLRCLRKPFVLTLHGGNLPAFAKRCPRRVRRLLHLAAVVTTPSRYLLEQLRGMGPDIRLLPNAIELRRYPFRQRTSPSPKLVWVRAFHEIYNPCMAPRAVAHLLEMGDLGSAISDLRSLVSDLHLTMLGPDKGDGSLERMESEVRRLKLEGRISLPGPVPKRQVPDALSSGDIFLNTTNFDNTPVSVIEAMACGLCIVSTSVGGMPYLVEDGKDGLLVPPDDPPAMAAAVRRILTEPGLAEKLSRNARAKAEQFDWAMILPQWEKLLTEVAENGPRDH